MGDKKGLPGTFYLSPPRPNPFGQGTAINYGLPQSSRVKLCVFDAAGRLVKPLADGTQTAGRYSLVWNGKDTKGRQLANGIYFIRLQTDGPQFQRKALLARP
jgi:flagellar hook assembly protein FlgD